MPKKGKQPREFTPNASVRRRPGRPSRRNEPYRRLVVEVPESLVRRLELLGRTHTEGITAALETYLKEQERLQP